MKKTRRLPTSGYESVFSYAPWGTEGRNVDNCYAYAVGDHRAFRTQKSVPGVRMHMNDLGMNYKTCKGLRKRVLADNPGRIYSAKPDQKCKKDFYKIMMFVAPTNDLNNSTGDFHFYKQHGYVKHTVKPGDTFQSLAKFYRVPYSRVYRCGPLVPGKEIRIQANVWSHKQGWGGGPLLTDACGKIILDPRKACRKYTYNYSKFCSSFCVKDRGIDVE